MEIYLGPEYLEHLPKHRVIQNGDTGDNNKIPTGRGVGYLDRFQRRVLPYTNSELDPKQVFNFIGYQFDLNGGKVRPTPERWQALTNKIETILSGAVCLVQQLMSLIGLLTAAEKQVHLGRYQRLEGTRVTRKGDPSPQVSPPSLEMVARGKQCASRSTITPSHPLKHALQIFTDASDEGWGAATKVFLVLQRDFCLNNIVLVARDSTTVVAYINRERRGMKVGRVCTLLWRILTWCTRRQVTLKARHITGWLNVIADKLSRLGKLPNRMVYQWSSKQ